MSSSRSALVIATSEYANPALAQLRSPASDAAAVAAVLGDSSIGDFDVEIALNQPFASLSARIGTFFSDRGRDDLLLLYVSCHGLKADDGELYFAATDTDVKLLMATAISASFLNSLMERSRSEGIILVLDCCYGGAFARGMRAKAGPDIDLGDQLAGNGRVVLTSTSAMEYAFEGDELTMSGESASGSYFTRFFVEGLATGDADLDADGIVTVDELFDYILKRMRASIPQ